MQIVKITYELTEDMYIKFKNAMLKKIKPQSKKRKILT